MAEFNKLIITNKGQALMSKIIAGTSTVEFTKISSSTNIYTESQILALTSLGNVKQTVSISKVTIKNSVSVQIEAAITNEDLTTGYNMNTIGIYAKDSDDGEILYAVASVESSDVGAYMPPYNNTTSSGAYIKLIITVSNSDNVTIEVDQAAVATIGDITDLNEVKIVVSETEPEHNCIWYKVLNTEEETSLEYEIETVDYDENETYHLQQDENIETIVNITDDTTDDNNVIVQEI